MASCRRRPVLAVRPGHGNLRRNGVPSRRLNVPEASDADEPHASTAAADETNSGEIQDGRRPGNAPEEPVAEVRDETNAAMSGNEAGPAPTEAGSAEIEAADVERAADEKEEADVAHAGGDAAAAVSSGGGIEDPEPDAEHESGGSGAESSPAEEEAAASPDAKDVAATASPGIERGGASAEAGDGRAAESDAASAGREPEAGPGNGLDDDVLTTAEAERIMELGQDGLSLAEIAAEMGRSEATVAAWNKGQRSRGLLPDLDSDDSEKPGDDGPGPGP